MLHSYVSREIHTRRCCCTVCTNFSLIVTLPTPDRIQIKVYWHKWVDAFEMHYQTLELLRFPRLFASARVNNSSFLILGQRRTRSTQACIGRMPNRRLGTTDCCSGAAFNRLTTVATPTATNVNSTYNRSASASKDELGLITPMSPISITWRDEANRLY